MKDLGFLLPKPVSVQPRVGRFRITADFFIQIHDCTGRRTFEGTSRFLARLAARTGVFLANPHPLTKPEHHKGGLSLNYQRRGDLVLKEDLSYRIEVVEEEASSRVTALFQT